jgi:hypothetical protein
MAVSKLRCRHCYRDLLDGLLFGNDRDWKACPRCSEDNGQVHVFLEYPEEFGTSDARITSENPDGAQSHCKAHRGNQPPDSARTRLCGQGVEPI